MYRKDRYINCCGWWVKTRSQRVTVYICL